MKIVSRPTSGPIGSGNYHVKIDHRDLQLIAALLAITRLGKRSIYQESAYKMICMLEETFGSDFLAESSESVDLFISISDDNGQIIDQFPYTEIVIEV